MLIKNADGQLCAPGALLSRFEWNHLMISARRHAREQEQRHVVIGVHGVDGRWHYVITAKHSVLHAQHQLEQERALLAKFREQERQERAAERLQRHCPHPGTFRGETCYACGGMA